MNNEAVVFILLGQSNAVGFKLHMDKADIIKTPLKNVYGLSRDKNQTFDADRLYWENYRSAGFNLGESNDNTYSVANCLAKKWQESIDQGTRLPDLYIVHIAVGAQGVTKGYMWNPDYPKKLIPGKLDTVDISLYQLTERVLTMVDQSMTERSVKYSFLPLWWRGGENDMTADADLLHSTLYDVYVQMIQGFRKSLGKIVPVTLHKIISHELADQMDPTGRFNCQRLYINQVFERLSNDLPEVSVIDPESFPQYLPNVHTNGVFLDDGVHFKREVNEYLAGQIVADFVKGR